MPCLHLFRHLAQKFLGLRQQRQEVVQKVSKGAHDARKRETFKSHASFLYNLTKSLTAQFTYNLCAVQPITNLG